MIANALLAYAKHSLSITYTLIDAPAAGSASEHAFTVPSAARKRKYM